MQGPTSRHMYPLRFLLTIIKHYIWNTPPMETLCINAKKKVYLLKLNDLFFVSFLFFLVKQNVPQLSKLDAKINNN